MEQKLNPIRVLCIYILLIFTYKLNAQERTIAGKVVEEKGTGKIQMDYNFK